MRLKLTSLATTEEFRRVPGLKVENWTALNVCPRFHARPEQLPRRLFSSTPLKNIPPMIVLRLRFILTKGPYMTRALDHSFYVLLYLMTTLWTSPAAGFLYKALTQHFGRVEYLPLLAGVLFALRLGVRGPQCHFSARPGLRHRATFRMTFVGTDIISPDAGGWLIFTSVCPSSREHFILPVAHPPCGHPRVRDSFRHSFPPPRKFIGAFPWKEKPS